MPTHKKGQDRDKYYQLAKDQGYRSRAAFKLLQINKRYDFLTKAKVCIDLCAAPGGWCQIAAKIMPAGSIVLGVDLLPIKPLRGVKTIVGDITTAATRKAIQAELQGWKADAVLCDGAPNIGSAYNKDAFVQNELVLAALKTATDHLNKGGTFCTKVYRSVDYNAIVWVLQQFFEDVQTMKPNSSRSQSSEIFLVCLGYTAPKNVDSRFFDPNHVFKEVSDPSLKKPDVLHSKRDVQKRHRTGYDESLGITLRSTATVSEFVESKEPVRLISDVNELKWSDACAQYRDHPATTEDILLNMQDLQVLSKIDFKKLLKWRQHIRDTYFPAAAPLPVKKEVEAEPVSEDVRIMQEISELRAQQAHAQRKELKKSRKELSKERERQRLGMQASAFEEVGDADLFSLPTNTTKKQLKQLADVNLDDVNMESVVAASDDDDAGDENNGASKRGQLIEILDHDLEDELENDYLTFMKRRQMQRLASGAASMEEERTKTSKRQARELSARGGIASMEEEDAILVDQESDGEAVNDEDELLEGQGRRKKARRERQAEMTGELQRYLEHLSSRDGKNAGADEDDDDDSASDSLHEAEGGDSDDNEDSGRKLVTSDRPSLQSRTQKWFSNPLFDSLRASSAASSRDDHRDGGDQTDEDEDKVLANAQMPKTEKQKRSEQRKKAEERRERKSQRQALRDQREGKAQLRTMIGGSALENDSDDNSENGDRRSGAAQATSAAGSTSFEIVPRENSSSLSGALLPQRHDERQYDSEEEDYDNHDRLLTLAMGTYMLRQSRRKALVDASYNRYAWNDPMDLPSWFVDDEMRHNKPQVPVPEALVDQIKNKYQLTGTKVIKKVAEARMRKRKRAAAKLKAAKKQAALMAENSELSERQKLKAIAKASSKYKGDKPSKVYVTTKKTKAGSVGAMGKGGGKGGKLKFVDKRMKKEVRAAKAAKRRSRK